MRFLSYIHIVMVISALCSVEGRLKATAKHQEQQQQQQQQQQLPSIKVVRRLQTTNELLSYSGSPPERHYPLQLCEGDCDEDSDVRTLLHVLILLVTYCLLLALKSGTCTCTGTWYYLLVTGTNTLAQLCVHLHSFNSQLPIANSHTVRRRIGMLSA